MQRILLIDDMPGFRDPVAAVLRRNGYEVACAASGKEANECLAAATPDLILLDMAMPDVDGLTFLNALRADPRHAAIPVIVLTAMFEKDLSQRLAGARVERHLIKSQFSLKELIATVRSLMASRVAAA